MLRIGSDDFIVNSFAQLVRRGGSRCEGSHTSVFAAIGNSKPTLGMQMKGGRGERGKRVHRTAVSMQTRGSEEEGVGESEIPSSISHHIASYSTCKCARACSQSRECECEMEV